jgi:hypothetical protein
LFSSGGVDADQFGNDFALAKIILGPEAAAEAAATGYRPLAPEHKDIAKYLDVF